MANSADPDQLASSEANRSGSPLFAKGGISGFCRTRVKDWFLFNRLHNRLLVPDINFQCLVCWLKLLADVVKA